MKGKDKKKEKKGKEKQQKGKPQQSKKGDMPMGHKGKKGHMMEMG